MRVVIINRHSSRYKTSSTLQCDLISSELSRHGFDVIYLAIDGACGEVERPYRTRDLSANFANLFDLLREERPDLIYWCYHKFHLLNTALQARLLNIPLVFACTRDPDVRQFATTIGDKSPVSFRRARRLMQRISSGVNYHGYYLVSGAIAQTRYQLARLPVKKKELIRNSYDPTTIPFLWPRPFVCWVGTVKAKKRPELFVKLARQCRDLEMDFVLVGRMAEASYTWIAEQSAELLENFYYLGERTLQETNGIIAASTFLVHTAPAEGFPHVLAQAWMNKKPTLTLDADPDQLIGRFEMGERCGSFERLVRSTRALILRPDEVRRRGENAFRRGSELCTKEINATRLSNFFWEVLEERDRVAAEQDDGLFDQRSAL